MRFDGLGLSGAGVGKTDWSSECAWLQRGTLLQAVVGLPILWLLAVGGVSIMFKFEASDFSRRGLQGGHDQTKGPKTLQHVQL